jgi:hypothetical protein
MKNILIILFLFISFESITSLLLDDDVYARGGDKGYNLHKYNNCPPGSEKWCVPRMP